MAVNRALILVICLSSFIISSTLSYIKPFITSTLAPVCAFPLISMVPMCKEQHVPIRNTSGKYQEPRFDQLAQIQSGFEAMIDTIGLTAYLGLGILRSGAAVRHLSSVVGFSPESHLIS
jgi:hypothetical protein